MHFAVKHLSVSAIQDWIDCPLRWYGRRIAHWTEKPSPDMALGKALHSAFEAHHKGEDAELALIRAWKDVTAMGGTPQEALILSIRSLGMYRRQNPRQDGDLAERGFRVQIPGIGVPLIGIFDLVRGRDLHEFKTGRARWGQQKVDRELQATAYWWAFGQVFKGVPDRIIYHLITTKFGSAVYTLETRRTDAEVLDFFKTARRAWAEIQAGQLWPGCTPSRCAFPENCEAYRDRV